VFPTCTFSNFSLISIFKTVTYILKARYSLFLFKVPLNPNQSVFCEWNHVVMVVSKLLSFGFTANVWASWRADKKCHGCWWGWFWSWRWLCAERYALFSTRVLCRMLWWIFELGSCTDLEFKAGFKSAFNFKTLKKSFKLVCDNEKKAL